MVECIFTLDYEIYGNGTGSLKDLVYEPGERLREIFRKWNAPFVNFVEVAELEQIEAHAADPAIDLVKAQIKVLSEEGHETALHLHPQWSNARYESGRWILDYSEYNLCRLAPARISQIVSRSLTYMRRILDRPDFTPVSFRAGNWLFQPTRDAARVLSASGIKVDSSVFKGGMQRNHGLDYRRAKRNGYYWPFSNDVNEPDPEGAWIEVPIYTDMVPLWKLATAKRVSLGNSFGGADMGICRWLNRISDFARFRYPRKFDFCRMTWNELTSVVNTIVRNDRKDPTAFRPIVAIGHTKDLSDSRTVDDFLAFLHDKAVPVSTFERSYTKLLLNRRR
jgi:hypothetical protein